MRNRDRGDCRRCGVSLADRVAMTHGKGIWLCEACYSAVRDAVDAAVRGPERGEDPCHG